MDGVFIGPADLSADMGFAGNPQHPEVQHTIDDAIARIRAAGKAPGILMANKALAQRYLEAGALFVAVGGYHRCWRGGSPGGRIQTGRGTSAFIGSLLNHEPRRFAAAGQPGAAT